VTLARLLFVDNRELIDDLIQDQECSVSTMSGGGYVRFNISNNLPSELITSDSS